MNRRELLGSVSAFALIAATQVEALVREVPRARTQFQLDNNLIVFLDLMKTSIQWEVLGGGNLSGSHYEPSLLDPNGYPTSLVGAGAITQIEYPFPLGERSGTYKVTFEGNG